MSNQATNRDCEICEEMALCYLHSNIWMCNACWVKEQKAKVEAFNLAQSLNQIPPVVINSVQPTRIDVNSVLREASTIDSTVQVRTDIFNAKTAAINEIKAAIDSDDSIQNKPYALAEFLKNRFVGLKKVIFEHNQVIIDAGNEQKAIQVYLNQLANSLRKEEREKLKIADINYNPAAQKISKPRTIKTDGTKKTKFDKVALRKAAAETGFSEFTIQSVAVAKGISVQDAVIQLRNSIAASKG